MQGPSQQAHAIAKHQSSDVRVMQEDLLPNSFRLLSRIKSATAAESRLVGLLEGHVASSTLAQEAQSAGIALLKLLISMSLVGILTTLSANNLESKHVPPAASWSLHAGCGNNAFHSAKDLSNRLM